MIRARFALNLEAMIRRMWQTATATGQELRRERYNLM